jgi:hypothetical protein
MTTTWSDIEDEVSNQLGVTAARLLTAEIRAGIDGRKQVLRNGIVVWHALWPGAQTWFVWPDGTRRSQHDLWKSYRVQRILDARCLHCGGVTGSGLVGSRVGEEFPYFFIGEPDADDWEIHFRRCPRIDRKYCSNECRQPTAHARRTVPRSIDWRHHRFRSGSGRTRGV